MRLHSYVYIRMHLIVIIYTFPDYNINTLRDCALRKASNTIQEGRVKTLY